MYKSITNQLEDTKKLQIITEGKNTEHIKKAIEILDSSLLDDIVIISGAEDKTGTQQLKNAFDVMSSAEFSEKCLFVWDCDFTLNAQGITETINFKKFCFAENTSNTKARNKNNGAIGIENLYPDYLFTDDVY